MEHALQVAAQLERCIDVAIQHLSARDLEQLQALPSLVGGVQEALAAFRLRQQQASATSVSLEDEFAAFSEAIHGLVEALQSHDITRQQVEHALGRLSTAISSMTPMPIKETSSQAPSDTVPATEELRTRIDELHVSSEGSLACSQRIRAVAATLIAEVRLAADRFTVGELLAEALNRSRATLHQLSAGGSIDPARVGSSLQNLTEQYTMLAEREVHEPATAIAAPVAREESDCQAPPEPSGDLGEGVELL